MSETPKIRVTHTAMPVVHPDRDGVPAAAMVNLQGFTLHVTDEEARRPGDANIFFFQRAYRQVMEHLSSETNREHGGLLLGYDLPTQTPTVWIVHALPALNAKGNPTRVEFDHEVWREFERQEEQIGSLALKRIGWYHSHPNIAIFLSHWDLDACKEFDALTQVALVVDPVNVRGGFFVRGIEGYRDTGPQGFWEVHDTTADSIVRWTNLVHVPGPAAAATQASPAADSASAQVSAESPERQPGATEFSETPSPRRTSVAALLESRPVTAMLLVVNMLVLVAVTLVVVSMDRNLRTLLGGRAANTSAESRPAFTVEPQGSEVIPGGQVAFRLTGQGADEMQVTWKIVPNIGSMAEDGTYTAPINAGTEQVVAVHALRAADGKDLGQSAVRLLSPVGELSIRPNPAGPLAAGQTVTFSAVGAAAAHGVRWSVKPPDAGTIAQDGVFTAASKIRKATTVTIIATSSADSSKTARIQLALQPKPEIAVSIKGPKEIALLAGQKHKFEATVANATDSRVRWEGQHIDGAGLFTAPDQISGDTKITVKAISIADGSKSDSVVVLLKKGSGAAPPVTVAVKPTAETVAAGQTMQLTATVTGTENREVSWSVLAGPGKVDGKGIYTPPGTVKKDVEVRVQAVSRADKSKKGEARFRVVPAPATAFEIKPKSAELAPGGKIGFVVTATGLANSEAEWRIDPADRGAVTQDGEYTAPAVINEESTVTIVAVSKADNSKTARASVKLKPAESP